MFFGSARTTKANVAAEVAALAAWRTVDRGDRVGAVVFDDEESVQIKPQRSRSSVLRICHELVRMNNRLSVERRSDSSGDRLNEALQHAANVAKHDHLVILITDYDGDDERTREIDNAFGSTQRRIGCIGLRSAWRAAARVWQDGGD